MSDETYHVTTEDVRKMESKEAKLHDGKTSKESDVSALKSILEERQPSKAEKIDQVKANLPLPEDPLDGKAPPPDFNSIDERTVNVGSGGVSAKLGMDDALREPATAESGARVDGNTFKTNVAPRNENMDMNMVDKATAKEHQGKKDPNDVTGQ